MNWEGFNKYVGIQGVLVTLLTVAVIVMMFLSRDVPREIWALIGTAWGFWFARNGKNITERIRHS